MSKEDHQPLHLRYLDQHEAHADCAKISDQRRQHRQQHPLRETHERRDDVVDTGQNPITIRTSVMLIAALLLESVAAGLVRRVLKRSVKKKNGLSSVDGL